MQHKNRFKKIISASLITIYFLGMTYGAVMVIAALFLGDYGEAQRIMDTYDLFHKILIVLLTAGILGIFAIISAIIYRIGTMLFEKDK